MTLLGPSPWVHRGWVVKDTPGLIQHARLVMVPDPKASEAEYELEVVDEDELPRSRLVEKQPPPGALRLSSPEAIADPPLGPDRAGGEVLSSSSSSALKACSVASSKWPLGRSREGYADLLRGEHWELKKLQDLENNDIPEDDIRGAVHGATNGASQAVA